MKEMEELPTQQGRTDFKPENYDISFDNVNFSYDGGRQVLKDVSFLAKQGEMTALVGSSGSGKSTAAKLSARFWDIQSGKITLGGTDISLIDPETLLKYYSVVFQDVVLFNTSILENIRIGKRGATDEEVMSVARLAQCDEFVKKMPHGYQTIIGENGETTYLHSSGPFERRTYRFARRGDSLSRCRKRNENTSRSIGTGTQQNRTHYRPPHAHNNTCRQNRCPRRWSSYRNRFA